MAGLGERPGLWDSSSQGGLPGAAPGVKREAEDDWGSLLGPPASLSVIQSISQWQVYSAGRDIPAKLISGPSTGTKLDIAANDQIRPIATTTAIPTIHARICIPSTSR